MQPAPSSSDIALREQARSAAGTGDLGAMIRYARLLREGCGGPHDPTAAEAWLRFALVKALVTDDDRAGTMARGALADLLLARGASDEALSLLGLDEENEAHAGLRAPDADDAESDEAFGATRAAVLSLH